MGSGEEQGELCYWVLDYVRYQPGEEQGELCFRTR